MIVVSGVFEVAATSLEPAIAAAREMAAATREEPGCRSYAFYVDVENETRVRVFEEWDDLEALQRHFQTPHMATFRAALGKLEILSRDVKRYTVSDASQL